MAIKPTDTQVGICSRFSGELVESGADAIVIVYSATRKNKTDCYVVNCGNELLCSALLRHAYNTETYVYIDEEDEE
jgi:hypothetical protein